jgi:hypothetical protein
MLLSKRRCVTLLLVNQTKTLHAAKRGILTGELQERLEVFR